jgi:hypothetical protein
MRAGAKTGKQPASTAGHPAWKYKPIVVRTTDLRNLDRETVRSTFREDLDQLLTTNFAELQQAYRDAQHDPHGEYPIPYLMNGTVRPLAILTSARTMRPSAPSSSLPSTATGAGRTCCSSRSSKTKKSWVDGT